ncbi:hypothetical protein P691DRAFT_769408 [Macrolepiota fuliginosa MF-IS2]|uniref:Uncharacterized protein n=1 Tax=Macrolepiota fuliginosa MF-IS2 TaxID=1400762 RepID=A0A9P6BVI7_9AGAR|nr:hypothetical protein P691DRAFT_769408 [Macrolepiota fuliginosa MF-IS2]
MEMQLTPSQLMPSIPLVSEQLMPTPTNISLQLPIPPPVLLGHTQATTLLIHIPPTAGASHLFIPMPTSAPTSATIQELPLSLVALTLDTSHSTQSQTAWARRAGSEVESEQANPGSKKPAKRAHHS